MSDSTVVRLLSWPTEVQFNAKIAAADLIEGDDYERKIVDVQVNDGIVSAFIYVSKKQILDANWKPILNGDWLQRNVTNRS